VALNPKFAHGPASKVWRISDSPHWQPVTATVGDDIVAMVVDLGDACIDRREKALDLIGFAGVFRRSEPVQSIARLFRSLPGFS
jgi:hypothetical protein